MKEVIKIEKKGSYYKDGYNLIKSAFLMGEWADDSEQLEALRNSLLSKIESEEDIYQEVTFNFDGRYMGDVTIYTRYFAGGEPGIVVVGQAFRDVVYLAKTAWRGKQKNK